MSLATDSLGVVRFLPSWLDETPGVIDAVIADADGELIEFLHDRGPLALAVPALAAALGIGSSLTHSLGGQCHMLQLTTEDGHVLACRVPGGHAVIVWADRTADLRMLCLDLAWDLRARFSDDEPSPEPARGVRLIKPLA